MKELKLLSLFKRNKEQRKLKYISLFSGIGAFEKALDRLGIPYELVGYCEIDKHASKSYSAIHNVPETMNLGDITKIDEKTLPKDIDLITYGFPCQDISTAGKMRGLFNEDGTQTRSGLFFEALRIIEATKPRVAIAENVKNLTSKKFNAQFQIVLASLEEAGYNNYWKVLNAKEFGIPQNRERVFIVSIRKDIDDGTFSFPEGFPLELRLKDVLEDVVDEKYYLSNKQLAYVLDMNDVALSSGRNINNRIVNPSIAKTISCRGAADQRADITNFVIDGVDKEMTVKELKELMQEPSIQVVGNYSPSGHDASRIVDANGIAPTVKENHGTVTAVVESMRLNSKGGIEDLRIRKFTPKECFRLQGFDDESFHKAEAVSSNTQLYKQAGNSICVPVVEHITKALVDCDVL